MGRSNKLSKKEIVKKGNELGNTEDLERVWAMEAFRHAETYFKLLSAFPDKASLKLTKMDDTIYTAFRQAFPDEKVDVFDEDKAKSKEGKEKWRVYMNQFENQIQQWNTLTLLRLDSSKDYAEDNTTVVPRIQWVSIELARNREGANNSITSS